MSCFDIVYISRHYFLNLFTLIINYTLEIINGTQYYSRKKYHLRNIKYTTIVLQYISLIYLVHTVSTFMH